MADDGTMDVEPVSSPGSDVPPESLATDASPVTDVATAPDDRPIQNVKAEFDRKLSKVERQLSEIAAMLAAQQPQRPAVVPEYTDQQLLELANAGNAAAMDALMERKTARHTQQQFSQVNAQQMIAGQLQALYARYPMLTDASHALTQAAMQAKMALVRNGYPPQAPATDLEAIKLAIVDNPGLVVAAASAPVSRSGHGPQSSVDGAMPRRTATTTSASPAVSQKAREVAQRMGIKDPAEAIKRFEKRQQDGRSSLSPLVVQAVREERA